MIRDIVRLIKFNLAKVTVEKKKFIIFLILLIYAITRSDYIYIPNLNMIDIVMVIQMNSPFVVIVGAIFSIYLGSSLFIEKDLDCFIKSRVKYKRSWLMSKIISILILNISICIITIIISFVIGIIIGKYGTGWSETILKLPPEYPYATFYSPYKLLFINTITFSFIMTLLALISGIIYLKTKYEYLGISISLLYMIGSSALSFLGSGAIAKAIIFINYIIFSRRNYFDTDSELSLMTTRQGVLYPVIAFIIIVGYCLFRVKHFEFKIGEKKYE